MKCRPFASLALGLISLLNSQFTTLFAQGTAFTYQGRLTDNGHPAAGSYDLRFSIYDADTAGNLMGSPLTNSPVIVSNGLMTVNLDPGPGIFTGPPRWLEIGMRTNGSIGAYFILNPRQPLTASPYAITAGNVTGPIDGGALIAGTVTGAQLAPGAAADNLGSSGQGGVASGGIVLSSNDNSSQLLNAGYVKLGRAELGEGWRGLWPVRRPRDRPTPQSGLAVR